MKRRKKRVSRIARIAGRIGAGIVTIAGIAAYVVASRPERGGPRTIGRRMALRAAASATVLAGGAAAYVAGDPRERGPRLLGAGRFLLGAIPRLPYGRMGREVARAALAATERVGPVELARNVQSALLEAHVRTFEAFKASLIALAQSDGSPYAGMAPEDAARLLAETYRAEYRAFRGQNDDRMSAAERRTTTALDGVLARILADSDHARGSAEAMRADPAWETVRALARETLGAFGWKEA